MATYMVIKCTKFHLNANYSVQRYRNIGIGINNNNNNNNPICKAPECQKTSVALKLTRTDGQTERRLDRGPENMTLL